MSELTDSEFIIIGAAPSAAASRTRWPGLGAPDILVLERAADVGQVTTSQGAGLCGQVRDSVERVKLAMHSVAVFRELQRDSASEAGLARGWFASRRPLRHARR